ncbi:MAG: 50S ribosomal protein L9 [Planctomycetota bacterium]
MKLLLCKNVSNLGIVGDVVDVSAGYGRNYLLPQRMATDPTEANMRRLKEARRQAEEELALQRKQLESLAQRITGVEVTIPARANEEGVLYGSVGKREIARALADEGHPILPEHVVLHDPIRRIDTVTVEIRLASDLHSEVKVWVVREKSAEEEAQEASGQGGTEAGGDEQGDR